MKCFPLQLQTRSNVHKIIMQGDGRLFYHDAKHALMHGCNEGGNGRTMLQAPNHWERQNS